MPFYVIDKDGHLAGLMNVSCRPSAGEIIMAVSTVTHVRQSDPSILVPHEVHKFTLSRANDWYGDNPFTVERDRTPGLLLQRYYVDNFRAFVPNPFYMGDREDNRPRLQMPNVEVTSVPSSNEIRLCEDSGAYGFIPRRFLTPQEWAPDAGIQRWRQFSMSAEAALVEDRRLAVQRQEKERTRKLKEAATRAEEKLERIRRTKDALHVVRKVHLD
jgi:hypothetical protein